MLRVADGLWIATALLHREQPNRLDFTIQEIEARLGRESLAIARRPDVDSHLSVHCVANLPPSGRRYRILLETAPSRRRLYRLGNP